MINKNLIFSADERNQSPEATKIAESIIGVDAMIAYGKECEEQHLIDVIESAKLQADIIKHLYEGPLP